LQADSHVTSFAVTGASVAQASTLQGYAKLSGFSISDAAANAVVSGLDGLVSASKLSSIGLTDGGTPPLSISYGQYHELMRRCWRRSAAAMVLWSAVPRLLLERRCRRIAV
jgi:hypothetical protein